MAKHRNQEWIVVTEDARTVPVIEILTGRGFITGKSGSGKSNSASVIAEELLENGYNLLIVDTEGEYFGLKERYELLHVGADDYCDVQVGPEHAEKIAEIAIKRNMPVILDVSGYFEVVEAMELIEKVVTHLYKLEKEERKPFLLMVEEMQEYLPQKGGGTDLAKLLERVAKRGRKRGLGICGMSQRPSSVDKDFITQCDWMIWHRLNWETDVNVVRNILGSERAKNIQEFDPGEGILMTDWDDKVEHVQFRRKKTHDAGATPGLESYERPDLKAVGSELISEIKGAGPHTEMREFEGFSGEDEDDSGLDEPELVDDAPGEGVGATSIEAGGSANTQSRSETNSGGPGVERVDVLDEPLENLTVANESPETTADAENPQGLLERERRRSEILEDEVRELRQILEAVGDTDRPALAEAATEAGPSPGESPAPAETPSIEPPRPPRRPPNRTGTAGTLVEFGEMVIYLLKSTWYRLRLFRYNHL